MILYLVDIGNPGLIRGFPSILAQRNDKGRNKAILNMTKISPGAGIEDRPVDAVWTIRRLE